MAKVTLNTTRKGNKRKTLKKGAGANATAEFLAHDLRSGAGQQQRDPLSKSFYFIPIVFYVGVVGLVLMMLVLNLQMASKNSRIDTLETKEQTAKRERAVVETKIKSLEKKREDGARILRWVEGNAMTQPLLVSVLRSADETIEIDRLSLVRDRTQPGRYELELHFSTDLRQVSSFLDNITTHLASLGWRMIPTQQVNDRFHVRFKAYLLQDEEIGAAQ